MGTHPIFESDFDCLTDRLTQKMNPDKLRSSRLTSELEAKVLPAGRRRSCTRLPTLTTKNSSRSSRSSPSTPFPVSRKLTCSEMTDLSFTSPTPRFKHLRRPTLSPFLARLKINRFRKCSLTSLTSWDLKDSPLSANSRWKK